MQAEEPIQIDGAVTCGELPPKSHRARDGDARTHGVIGLLAVRHNDVEGVRRTALKEANQGFALRRRPELHAERGTTEKTWTQPHCYQGQPSRFHKYSAVHMILFR
jgi:hypothetical protein